LNVVIIGCGVVGAAIAYELTQTPHLTVMVLERQPGPALAATGAALGVLMGAISQKSKGNNLTMRLFGIQQYNQWVPHLEALTGHKIPFNQQGILRLCFVGEDLERWQTLAQIRQQQGWKLEICDRAFLAAHYPHLSLDRVIGAVYSPDDRQIDPTALTQALVLAAQHQGATIHFKTQVETIMPLAAKIRIDTSQGAIEADWLVIAAGIGATALTKTFPQPIDIRPVLGQAVRIKLPTPLGRPHLQPVITGEDVHLVPLGADEYWIGATVEFPNDGKNLAELPQPGSEQLRTVMQQAIALCPALESATILHQWYGLRPRPEGRPAPIIEALPGYPQIILATGHYRNGVLLAPATAHLVREIIA
jgi:glycine/D-amino acid oxidase-like deaminating enzyme